jgi:hypothetical protein
MAGSAAAPARPSAIMLMPPAASDATSVTRRPIRSDSAPADRPGKHCAEAVRREDDARFGWTEPRLGEVESREDEDEPAGPVDQSAGEQNPERPWQRWLSMPRG